MKEAVSSGNEEARKKAEALLAAANADLNTAETDAKKDVEEMKNDGATPVVEAEAAALENELAVEDAAKDEDAGAEDDTDVLNERGADFNEEDVVPSADDDVCALKTVECVGASEGVQPSDTFIKSLTTNGNIIEEGRMQALKQWNDALSEQIKVSALHVIQDERRQCLRTAGCQ